ncbi:hypothetical protein FPV67DRAFT_1417206 [Lyophyllum atratum]|nr:hypothetical protein FPV67DRAFT_1417206 [Lyophyllum atratum]
MSEVLYRRTTHGQFVPIEQPGEQVPKGSTSVPEQSANAMDWDGWPDGEFEKDFTFRDFEESDHLKVHWAVRVGGGDRRGDIFASDWKGGKRSTRQCLGVLECDNPRCQVITRPKTTPKAIDTQLQGPCTSCGAKLIHELCGVKSQLWTWSGGVHYSNGGFHAHQRESVADISDVFLNADRVSKERSKLKRGTELGGDGFIAAFSIFCTERPNFVINHIFGPVTVISVQTLFMRSQIVKEELLDGPINGTVNDAAHGWWKERNSLLMITSTYCPTLFCWVPALISYTNGASAEHYQHHFDGVMQSTAREAERQKIPITDHMFAGVMDFSEAERKGFTLAFIAFWIARPEDSRSHGELEEAAGRLLRGCREHFRAGVTRVSRISGAVPPQMVDVFVSRAFCPSHHSSLVISRNSNLGLRGGCVRHMRLCFSNQSARWMWTSGNLCRVPRTPKRPCIGNFTAGAVVTTIS